jgi:hypothetical protein
MIVQIEEMGSSGGALINTCLNLRICRITVFAYPRAPTEVRDTREGCSQNGNDGVKVVA